MSDDNEDPGQRVRNVLLAGIGSIEARMAALTGKKKPTPADLSQILTLTKESATILSHVRRYDQAMREATRGLSPAVVIAYLRSLPEDRMRAIMAELGAEPEDEERGSVLS